MEPLDIPKLRDQIIFFVKQTRAMAGMTREEFGSFIGHPAETVRNWERGLTVPRADAFLAIMEVRRRILRARRRGEKEERGE